MNAIKFRFDNLEEEYAEKYEVFEKECSQKVEAKEEQVKRMYLDMTAELKVKDLIIEKLRKKIGESESQVIKVLRMVHYPRLVHEL